MAITALKRKIKSLKEKFNALVNKIILKQKILYYN